MIKVILSPSGESVEVPNGTSLLDAIRRAKPTFYAPCAGRGICGKCRVKVEGDAVGAASSLERARLSPQDLACGVRLACQVRLDGDVIVREVSTHPTGAPASILADSPRSTDYGERLFEVRHACVDSGSLEGGASLWERVTEAFQAPDKGPPSPALARALPRVVVSSGGAITGILMDGRIVEVVPAAQDPDHHLRARGIAIDIGTTTVVAYLLDLLSGTVLGVASAVNPQTVHGADVISRIEYSASEEGLAALRREIVGVVNLLIEQVAIDAGDTANDIHAVCAVGNTCMHHLFLGISPRSLAQYPYISVTRDVGPMSPDEVGITINPMGRFWFLPNIAGFVGSDTLAVALACGLNETGPNTLAVDLGTNGEVVLSGGGRVLACSTAAGPAFEGVNISSGMAASPGAVDAARLVRSGVGLVDIECHVIGNIPPAGICGSGLAGVAAALRLAGVLERGGRFCRVPKGSPDPIWRRVREGPGGPEFLLSDPCDRSSPRVSLTQKDVRELQLAKGAIRAGVEILLRKRGISADEVERVLLAGAFGTYLDPDSVSAIGLLPASLARRAEPVGNAAGHGAVLALVSRAAHREAQRLASVVEHVELAS
ncbi:MAG: ASKHA domain-containing protein, partial [Firmicutes bacterium]|nr:ASKHA domain-containing protein [Bacillota bacterium]